MKVNGKYAPGIYTGYAQGFGGIVSAQVEVDTHRILSITTDVECETPQLAELPKTELVQAIIVAGSVDVDGISGATITSNAIKSAVSDALSQADLQEKSFHDSLSPGVYETNAVGYGGEIKVATKFNKSGIENIWILSSDETPGIGKIGAEMMIKRIRESGFLSVDGISGATVTSSAIKQAVSNAIAQAGGKQADFIRLGQLLPKKEHVQIEADVIVVGAGISGFCAAIEALDNRAKVILLEKLDIVGGTAIVAGGAFMAVNSYLNADNGDRDEELAQWWYERQEYHYNVNYEHLAFVAHSSGDLVNWIHEKSGVNFELGYGGGSPKKWSHRPVLLPNEVPNGHGTPRLIWGLRDYFISHGGILRCGVRATKLVQDQEGNIIGVLAESKDKIFSLTANGGVIIATGGYDANPDLVKELAPNCVHMISNGYTAGDTGDGILMGKQVGAKIAYSGYLMGSWNTINGIDKFGLDALNMKHKVKCIEINGRMERFYNENSGPIQEKWEFAKDGTGEFYVIFDSSLERTLLDKLNSAVDAGVVIKQDSIEALAKSIGKSSAALTATVERWNELSRHGMDLDFGNPLIEEFDNGPYYLCRVYEMSTGSYGGLKVSLNAEVINENEQVIPGLYAVGESANGEFYYRNYVCGGSSFSMSGVFGRVAGKNAAMRAKR